MATTKRPPVDPRSREWAIAITEACHAFNRQKGVRGFWDIVRGFMAHPEHVRHEHEGIEYASVGMKGIMGSPDQSLFMARIWPIVTSRTNKTKSAGLPYYLGPFTRVIDAVKAYDLEQGKLGQDRLCYFTPAERKAGRAFVPVDNEGFVFRFKCHRDELIEKHDITDDQLTEAIITDE